MAEIFIKNMEMPNGCYECPLGKHEERSYYYECNSSDGVNIDWYTIPAYCPLVELPPHGELIERDYIRKAFEVLFRNYLPEPQVREAYRIIGNAPTILEASK